MSKNVFKYLKNNDSMDKIVFSDKEMNALFDGSNGVIWSWHSFVNVEGNGLVNLKHSLIDRIEYSVDNGLLDDNERIVLAKKINAASDDELKEVVMKIGEYWGDFPIEMPTFPTEEDIVDFELHEKYIYCFQHYVDTLDNLKEVLYGTVIEDFVNEYKRRLEELKKF